MYRRQRKIYGSYGSGSKLSFGFKMLLVGVALVAAISAFITGAVLSKTASKSAFESFGRHNLADFGGVKQPAEDYTALRNVKAGYANAVGADKQSFKKELAALPDGNAVVFKANDRDGNIFFDTALKSKIGISGNVMSYVTAEDIVNSANAHEKISIAHFYSTALSQPEDSLRAVKSAEELALISELCDAGLYEIAIFDLPDDSDLIPFVTAYLAWIEAESKRTNICVVLSKTNVESAGATRIINATEGYADAYAIDMSEVSNKNLGDMIEKCAYFITNYNARIIVSAATDEIREEAVAILKSYGIDSYEFVK